MAQISTIEEDGWISIQIIGAEYEGQPYFRPPDQWLSPLIKVTRPECLQIIRTYSEPSADQNSARPKKITLRLNQVRIDHDKVWHQEHDQDKSERTIEIKESRKYTITALFSEFSDLAKPGLEKSGLFEILVVLSPSTSGRPKRLTTNAQNTQSDSPAMNTSDGSPGHFGVGNAYPCNPPPTEEVKEDAFGSFSATLDGHRDDSQLQTTPIRHAMEDLISRIRSIEQQLDGMKSAHEVLGLKVLEQEREIELLQSFASNLNQDSKLPKGGGMTGDEAGSAVISNSSLGVKSIPKSDSLDIVQQSGEAAREVAQKYIFEEVPKIMRRLAPQVWTDEDRRIARAEVSAVVSRELRKSVPDEVSRAVQVVLDTMVHQAVHAEAKMWIADALANVVKNGSTDPRGDKSSPVSKISEQIANLVHKLQLMSLRQEANLLTRYCAESPPRSSFQQSGDQAPGGESLADLVAQLVRQELAKSSQLLVNEGCSPNNELQLVADLHQVAGALMETSEPAPVRNDATDLLRELLTGMRITMEHAKLGTEFDRERHLTRGREPNTPYDRRQIAKVERPAFIKDGVILHPAHVRTGG